MSAGELFRLIVVIRSLTISLLGDVSSCVTINATRGAVMYTGLSKSFSVFSEKNGNV